MRGRRAKRIRKEVYGDLSLRIERQYRVFGDGSVRNVIGSPLRRYQEAKKKA